jgi:Uma2 family endonuclease
MATLINDAGTQERLIAERVATGADRFDEVWEGAYMMTPLANDEHQDLSIQISSILQWLVGWSLHLGVVRAPTNLSDREIGWERNFRVPDIAVFLNTTKAKNCGTHWCGPADLLVEIVSPDDLSREKLSFYSKLGVQEVMLIDRDPWALELYHLQDGQLQLAAKDTLDQAAPISLTVLPVDLRLQPGPTRPLIEITHRGTTDVWLV